MIKILKKPIYYKATCKKCGAIITYEEEDLKGDYTKHVRCPICREEIIHRVLDNAIYEEQNNETN